MARAVQPVPGGEVLLAGELGRAVRRQREPRIVLARRPLALAVDRAAGRREHDLRALRRLQHAQRADDVHLGVVGRPLHRGDDVRLRGEMEHRVRLDLERLADVVLDELRLQG